MGLLVLIFGLVLLLGAHVFVTFRKARAAAIDELGRGYRLLFSLFALAGLALVIWGYSEYRAHEWVQVWTPPPYMRHITVALMLLSAIMFTATYVPSHIKAWLKHPMLASVKTWALAHLLVERRPRLDRAVRRVPGLGRLCARRRQDARRPRLHHAARGLA